MANVTPRLAQIIAEDPTVMDKVLNVSVDTLELDEDYVYDIVLNKETSQVEVKYTFLKDTGKVMANVGLLDSSAFEEYTPQPQGALPQN